jgi:hypothetical protein
MLNKNILFTLILLVLVAPLISSQSTQIPVYSQNEALILSVPCTNNGNICSPSTNCSATIISPTQQVLFNGASMTKNNSIYSINLNSNQTQEIGYYEFTVICSQKTRNLQFEITPNGERPTTAKGILYAGLILLLFLLFGTCVYYFINSKDLLPRIATSLVAYLFLIAIAFVAWNMSLDFLTSTPFIPSMFRIMFYFLLYALFPLILVLSIYGIYMMIEMKEIQKLIDRGIPEAEIAERNERKNRRKSRRW